MATSTKLIRTSRWRVVVPFAAASLVVATAVAGGVAVAGPASADPTITIAQAEAQLAALDQAAANANELYNGAQVQLAGINAKIGQLRITLKSAQAQVNQSSRAVDAMALNTWTSGGADGTLQVLLSTDPQQFLDRASALDVLGHTESADLRRTQAAKLALLEVQVAMGQQQAAAAVASQTAADQLAIAHQKIADQTTLINSLQAAERARLEAALLAKQQAQRAADLKAKQAAQAAFAAQAAQAAAAAAAAASKPKSNGGNSNGGGGSSNGGGGNSGGDGGTPPNSGGGSPSGRAQIAVNYALSQVGGIYSLDANPPNTWDCSKLTSWAWKAAGVYLDPYSYSQWSETTRVSQGDLQPGDLLFYFRDGAHHVEMYIGGGRAVSASNPSVGVEIQNDPFGGWYGDHYSGAGRVL